MQFNSTKNISIHSTLWLYACTLFLLCATTSFSQDDYSSWSYNDTLRLNTTSGGANVTTSDSAFNFPVLIRLNSGNFNFSQAMSNGEDIRFGKTDDTHMPYQIERWDNAGELAEIWVKVDTVYPNNSTQKFVMYWGNGSALDSSVDSTVFDTAQGFSGVWHLGEDGNVTADGYEDATANRKHGTGNSLTSTSDVPAVAGIGQTFDGAADYISLTSISPPTQGTFSFWVNSNAMATQYLIGGNTSFNVGMNSGGYIVSNLGGGNVTSSTSLGTSSWYHVVASYDTISNAAQVFINGNMEVNNTSATIDPTSVALNFGFQSSMYFDGTLDEIQFSHVLRSGAWIKLSYENQKASQTLVVGPTLPPEDYANWSYSTNIILNTTATGANITGTVNNFPVLLRLNAENFTFSDAKADGTDIRFSTDGGAHIPYEIALWDNGNEQAQLWVNVPVINGNNNSQYITMYWGKSDAGDSSNSAAVFGGAYEGVWHLDDVGTVYDVTSNSNDGTNNGAVNTPGHIGGAANFNGPDYINLPASALSGISTQITVSLWQNGDVAIQPQSDFLFSAHNGGGTALLGAMVPYLDGSIYWDMGNPYDRLTQASGGPDDYEGVWNHWVFTKNTTSGDMRIYKNGVMWASASAKTATLSGVVSFAIGANSFNQTFNYDGFVDEFRVSSVERTADWIQLEFQNQRLANTLAPDYGQLGSLTLNDGPSNAALDTAVITGATSVPIMHFKMQTGSVEDIALDTIEAKLVYGDTSFISSLKLAKDRDSNGIYDGADTIITLNTVSSIDSIAVLTFTSALDTILADSAAYYFLLVDLTAGNPFLPEDTLQFQLQTSWIINTGLNSHEQIPVGGSNVTSSKLYGKYTVKLFDTTGAAATIQASQRTDGTDTVDIYYRLWDEDDSYDTVQVFYKNGISDSWNLLTNMVGDTGAVTANDSLINRKVSWDAAAQLGTSFESDSVQLMITAKDAGMEDTLTRAAADLVVDTKAPTAIGFVPADETTEVDTGATLKLIFSEAVDAAAGYIRIGRSSDSVIFDSVLVTGGLVTGSGTDTITVNPDTSFDGLVRYFVLVDPGAFGDAYGNSLAEISDTSIWNFETTLPGVRIWDGGGSDTLWTTAANWSGDIVPSNTDSVVFNGTSVKDCGIGSTDDTVRAITFTGSYSGNVDFSTAVLTINGDADFTGATFIGSPVLIFEGNENKLTPPSANIPGTVDFRGNYTLLGNLDVNDLYLYGGNLDLGTGFNHTLSSLNAPGSGDTLKFNTSSLTVAGAVELSSAILTGTSSDTLRLTGSGTHSISYLDSTSNIVLQINATGTYQTGADLSVNNIVVSSGTLDLTSYWLNIHGDADLSGATFSGSPIVILKGNEKILTPPSANIAGTMDFRGNYTLLGNMDANDLYLYGGNLDLGTGFN
ncbi:MAG: DUF2341 domain-containing protein, partial [Fibrobacteria bacterium]|nr:DUF2341 domain-containing protein [Fibrobacteria bacterium]